MSNSEPWCKVLAHQLFLHCLILLHGRCCYRGYSKRWIKYIMIIKMRRLRLILLALLTLLIAQVQATPVHISGPDDVHVFKGEDVRLRCEVEQVSAFYAVVWQCFDGSDFGYTIGRCFGCSRDRQCDQTPYDIGIGYTASRNGDVYELNISNVVVPLQIDHGYCQCSYAKAKGCDSPNPQLDGRLYPFQNAIVYVYEYPTCSSALGQIEGEEYFLDLACTLEPRFYSPKKVQTSLVVNGSVVVPDVQLPHGALVRAKADESVCLEQTFMSADGSQCNVTMPGGELINIPCDFPRPWNETVSAFIEPLNMIINTTYEESNNELIEIRCHSYPNSSLQRRWAFFKVGGQREDVTSSGDTMVGDVQFSSDTRYALILTAQESGEFFLECTVDGGKDYGGNVTAFASIIIVIKGRPTPTRERKHHTSIPSTEMTISDATYNGDGDKFNFILLSIVPAFLVVLVIIFLIGSVIRKRCSRSCHPSLTRRRSLKQPPRHPDQSSSAAGDSSSGVQLEPGKASVAYNPLIDDKDNDANNMTTATHAYMGIKKPDLTTLDPQTYQTAS